ncbi:MAG: hypothetical protein ACOYO1_13785 [Bacteroidales bacterium]
MNRSIFLIFILFISCTSLETFTSLTEGTEIKNDYRFYDTASKIRYQITNDDKNLFIRLNTVEKATIMKMLRSGFNFYFDVNGKKQKSVYFQYPIAHNTQLSVPHEKQDLPKAQRPDMDIKSMIVQASKMGIWVSNGKTEQISVLSKEAEISVNIEALNNTEITYELTIPLDKISANGITSLTNLSIGIVSGKLSMPSFGKGRGVDSQEEDGSVGMQGGRDHGGMPGGGRQHDGMQGEGRPDGNDVSAMTTPVEFWFKLNFTKR